MAVAINKDSIVRGLKAVGRVITGQVDYVFLGLLGAVTLAVSVFYGTEVTTPIPVVREPKPIQLEPKISAEEGSPASEVYYAVFEMLKPVKPFEDTEYQQLIDFNMFDAKAARDAEELHDEAKKRLNDAEEAFEKGNYDDARRLAQEALDRAPTMQAAVRLIERIEAATAPAEAETMEGEDEAAAEEDSGSPPEEVPQP
jgi:hypothetical protein